MVKSELVNIISNRQQNLPVKDIEVSINQVLENMSHALSQGNRIEIRGFGSFKVKEYEGYAGRNPKTGGMVTVQPKRLPFFRAGKELKEFLND